MLATKTRRRFLLVLPLLLAALTPVRAADPTEAVPYKPADVTKVEVAPLNVSLVGNHDARQLIVTGTLKDGRLQDLTDAVKYTVANPKVASVTASGQVIPLDDGQTTVTASFAGKTLQVAVTCSKTKENLPINFGNQVVPIFTKLGCNSGGCHGKISGQNGFRLSLLGFDSEFDYMTLVMEGRGRRLFPAAPEKSLLLQKASGDLPHGGGKRMEQDSDEYKMIRRWIASGAPFGKPTDPTVAKITVTPAHRVMTRANQQQIAVIAHYTDGTQEDVTRRAQYDSNDTDVAGVEHNGVIRTQANSGEAAIMVRYQGLVTVFRATVPLGMQTPNYTFPHQTIVDKHTHAKWQELGLVPSAVANDEQFIRRASLDITGTLPTLEQIRDFVLDKDPQKKDKLIDRLVDSEAYSYYFATKWADILRVKRRNQADRAFGTFAFHAWIRESLANDKPYDRFVREILAAVGDEGKFPPVFWYRELQTPQQFVDDTSQVFLGVRIACAQCHHHPYEKWTQDDYWSMAAFFGRIGRKNVPVVGAVVQNNQQRQSIFNRPTGQVINDRTKRPADIKALDADPMQLGPDDDPRHKLVDWMTDAKNPFFAKAVVNRYWAHFFGRGIVHEPDDMRVTNPPSNPALLDALAQDFIANKYSLKHLVKTLAKSRTYQLSSTPNEFNRHDRQSFARYYPKRMQAEVLYDAVTSLTLAPTPFPGLPTDTHAPQRAIMLPDESFQSYFLDVTGRPQRISACECERVSEASLAMVLHMLNSEEINQKVSRVGARADLAAKDPRGDPEKIEELFLVALGRKPTQEQMKLALEAIETNKTKKAAYEDIIWALLNTKEFMFHQ
jgi:hypothetical protein